MLPTKVLLLLLIRKIPHSVAPLLLKDRFESNVAFKEPEI